MVKNAVKLVLYRKNPTAAFLGLHPLGSLRVLRTVLGKGFIALPIGILIGMKLAQRQQAQAPAD